MSRLLDHLRTGTHLDAMAAYWAMNGVQMTIENAGAVPPSNSSRVLGYREATRVRQRLRGLAAMCQALLAEIRATEADVVGWTDADTRHHPDRDGQPGPQGGLVPLYAPLPTQKPTTQDFHHTGGYFGC